ncbi:hypothetical protein HK097_006530, partial [Rhizophlyctis rosea]
NGDGFVRRDDGNGSGRAGRGRVASNAGSVRSQEELGRNSDGGKAWDWDAVGEIWSETGTSTDSGSRSGGGGPDEALPRASESLNAEEVMMRGGFR